MPTPRPAGLHARTLAWLLDAAWLLPLGLLAAAPLWRPALGRAREAHAALEAAMFPRIEDVAMAGGSPMDVVTTLAAAGEVRVALAALVGHVTVAVLAPLLAYAALRLALVVACERGRRDGRGGGTPGKRAIGLEVRASDGAPLGAARAGLRGLAAGLSWASLHLGHLLVAVRADGRSLHDLLAGARVDWATGRDAPPRWARRAWAAFVLALGLAVLGVAAWLGQGLWLLATL
jgi:uncharacterized RDD family membrane protein YckC